jgi:CDP-diacylglycerol--serine O-phosphatidyltransferase
MEKRPKQLIFLLPNLFTASSIFAGVFSIISAVEGRYELAAWMILLSLLFDGLDGRVARLTHTCSRFGVEFDSLADIVAFGAAPAMLIYFYAGHDFGRFGIIASALFVIFGAIRLARFNVTTAKIEPSVFIGVPIPTAAVFTALLVLLFEKYAALASWQIVIPIEALLMSLLMVSNIRYPSFKKINLHAMHVTRMLVLVLVVASLIFLYPIEGFALFFILYVFYGPLRAAVHLYRRWRLIKK